MKRPRPGALIAGLAAVTAAWLLLLPPKTALPPQAVTVAAIAVFAIAFWATETLPDHATAIIMLLLGVLFAAAPLEVVFAGFQSTAFWLVVGGLVIGIAVGNTGLGARLAGSLAPRLGRSYASVIAGTVLVSVALAFIMPSSTARLVLLIPIMLAIADEIGFVPGRPGRDGIVIAVALGTTLPAFAILPANVPNLVLAGAAETQFGATLTYGAYLLLHFPVLGALKAALIVALVCWLLPDAPDTQPVRRPPRPLGAGEKRLIVLLAATLGLWATDSLHHVSAAWVALGAGAVCLMPPLGLVGPKDFDQRIRAGFLIYIAAIIGLGALVAHSGLGAALAEGLLRLVAPAPGAPFYNYFGVSLAAVVLGLLTTVPGLPAVMTPMSGAIAEATGLGLDATLMLQVNGFSTILLPYQAPALAFAIALGGASTRAATRVLLALAAATLLILLPLNGLWWRLLGYL